MLNSLLIGDVDQDALLNWLCENISPLVMTTRNEYSYFNMYHGDDDLWIMDTTDVSDVNSSKWDEITQVIFKNKDDLLLCKLTWSGVIEKLV
jgi:hypothetical protein